MNAVLVFSTLCAVSCFQPTSRGYQVVSRGSTNKLHVKNGLEDHQLENAINNPIKYEKTPEIVLGIVSQTLPLHRI